MKLYDVILWDPVDSDANEIICYRHEAEDFNTHSQLVVNQSQEAVFFKDGRALDLFGPGRHTLKTENIPLLSKIVNIPTGGVTPFKAKVYYVNKILQMEMKWGMNPPLQVKDPECGVLLNIGPSGTFAAGIADSRKFLTKIVGTKGVFTRTELKSFLRTLICQSVRDALSHIINVDRVSYFQASSEIKTYSNKIFLELKPIFEEYGVDLVRFDWDSIYVPPEQLETLNEIFHIDFAEKAMIKRKQMERDIGGYTRKEEMQHEEIMAAAQNTGMAGNMMGMSMGYVTSAQLAEAMRQRTASYYQTPVGGSVPNPGYAPNPAMAPPVQGAPSVAEVCAKCGATLVPGAKFCSECGTLVPVQKFCPQCGEKINSNAKFCANCGFKLQ